MRMTIDIPDDQYQKLKSRAGASGLTLPLLIQQLIERGLRSPTESTLPSGRHAPPPVIVPVRGVPIPAVSREEIRRIEEEDEASRGGLA
jgi:hypothetical protein